MKRLAVAFLPILLLLGTAVARAELTIEITQGVDNPTAIAVVPFAWAGPGPAPEDIAFVIDGDLARSGQFAPVARSDMLGMPSTEAELFYRDWRAIETEYILIGRVSANGQELRIDYELFDVLRQARVHSGVVSGPVSEARMHAHRVADAVYEKLTGIPGAFVLSLSRPRAMEGS